jgi:hypothetical protein
VTRPSITIEAVDAEGERIAVDVSHSMREVIRRIDWDRMEPTAEQRAVSPDALVRVTGEDRAQLLHIAGQSSIRTMDEQVEVVRHQAVRVNLDAKPVVAHTEEASEFDPVDVVEERRLTGDTSVHHMVPALGSVVSRSSSHAPIVARGCGSRSHVVSDTT